MTTITSEQIDEDVLFTIEHFKQMGGRNPSTLIKALRQTQERERILLSKLNNPETEDFIEGVRRETAHQIERWRESSDTGKDHADWFWLVGYLAGKALACALSGNFEKAKHHIITTCAALANWHSMIIGGPGKQMQPGSGKMIEQHEGGQQ